MFYYDPEITGITPSSGPTYGGTRITVTGRALSSNLIFAMGNGFASQVSCYGPTQCTMVTPPAREPGWANVVAVPQVGVWSPVTNKTRFDYLKPLPNAAKLCTSCKAVLP